MQRKQKQAKHQNSMKLVKVIPYILTVRSNALYRVIYFEGLDLVIHAIKARFEQPGHLMYKNLQEVLLKCAYVDKITMVSFKL